MTRPAKDEVREERIDMEIMPDAHGKIEQAISWYNYLSDTLQFPFSARCIVQRATSPLALGEKVTVTGMAPDEECEHDMLVLVRWKRRKLAVPLIQLEAVHGEEEEETQQAIEDWHYWVKRGHVL
jgi:Calcium binding